MDFLPLLLITGLCIVCDMDEKRVESCLDSIAGWVLDEDKIVSYKSLSKSLGIHINSAKQLLYLFLTRQKSSNSCPVSATYLLSGKLPDGSLNISIVNDCNLQSTRLKFVEITSEHVYSVHKGKNVKDVKVLYGIDVHPLERPSVIKCGKSILKSRAEEKKKYSSAETGKELIKEALGPSKPAVNSAETSKNSENSRKKDSAEKSTAKKTAQGTSNKAQTGGKQPAGDIAKLFAKAYQRNADKALNEEKSSFNRENVTEVADASPVEEKKVSSESGMKNSETGNGSVDILKRKKSRNKRRRIQMLSDSENSDNGDEEKSFVEEESSLDVANIEEEKEEAKEAVPKNKRKKRKVVDKTVMNEDGYLETRKEIIFETDSENEVEERNGDPEEKKAKVTPVIVKKKEVQTGNIPKKQSSLLTFFKKS